MARKKKDQGKGNVASDKPYQIAIALFVLLIIGRVYSDYYLAQSKDGIPKERSELAAGYNSGNPLGNPEGYQPEKVVDYAIPSGLPRNTIMFAGSWLNAPQEMVHTGESRGLFLVGFQNGSLAVQASSKNKTATVIVFYDGNYIPVNHAGKDVFYEGAKSLSNISHNRYYQILNSTPREEHLFIMAVEDEGFSVKGVALY